MTVSVLPRRDELRVRPGRLFIDGSWAQASDGGTWRHVHPATNEEVTTIAIGTPSDVDRAVRAARRAFDDGPWPRLKARERKRLLQPLVALLHDHSDELSRVQTLDNGMPISFSRSYRVSGQFAADVFDHYLGWIDKLTGQTYPEFTDDNALQYLSFRRPVGVVAAVTPWNGPLLQIPNKVAPALAAGNTVVLKPSEYASLTALRLAELAEQLDLPAGVFNVVTGPGSSTGEALVSHASVDKITFTGSRAVGEHIMSTSGKTMKRVTMELGGKSPSLVFPDAPGIAAAGRVVMGNLAFGLSGQVCSSQTRALVHRSVLDEFLDATRRVAESVRFGDPFDPATTSAPLINRAQLQKVMSYIDDGRTAGATLLFGGDRPQSDRLTAGNWVNPTLFTDVDNKMAIAQEEIFGPVLAVIAFDDEDEAVRMANDSRYGLSSGLYTRDAARAFRISRALRSGTVGVNGYSYMPNSPFGGFKESGLGREGGWAALEHYTELQTVMFNLDAQPTPAEPSPQE